MVSGISIKTCGSAHLTPMSLSLLQCCSSRSSSVKKATCSAGCAFCRTHCPLVVSWRVGQEMTFEGDSARNDNDTVLKEVPSPTKHAQGHHIRTQTKRACSLSFVAPCLLINTKRLNVTLNPHMRRLLLDSRYHFTGALTIFVSLEVENPHRQG